MRRIYYKVRQQTIETVVSFEDYIVPLVGFCVLFFGFGAGAILNLYLISVGHPLVTDFRSALTYKSAIFGDGLILPVTAMVATAFILKNRDILNNLLIYLAVLFGAIITAWFHISQAINGVINWAMPTPWHWNFLGLWHGVYMLGVASLFSLFYLVVIRKVGEVGMVRGVGKEALLVTIGFIAFFTLLRFDYL